jgi:hypothetical protein
MYACRDGTSDYERAHVFELAVELLRRTEGWIMLPVSGNKFVDGFGPFLAACEDQYVPSAVEAFFTAGIQVRNSDAMYGHLIFDQSKYASEVNRILSEDRISFELIEGRMVPFESRELHSAVIRPALTLLGGDHRLEAAERAYQEALKEIAEGKADNAITDAARALQETLVALGCEGKSLGPLLVSARKRKLLAPHDTPFTDLLAKAIDWASADRAEMGDAHKDSGATPDDAWFAVHVIGAIIVRLAKGSRG